MTVAVSGKNTAIGGIVGAVGAVVAIVGAFAPAETANASGLSLSASFWDGNAGKTIAVVSLIALALAVAWLYGRLLIAARSTQIVIILAGVVVLLVVAYNWGSINDDINKVNQVLPGAASLGIGMWLTIVGGLAMVVGGALGLAKRS